VKAAIIGSVRQLFGAAGSGAVLFDVVSFTPSAGEVLLRVAEEYVVVTVLSMLALASQCDLGFGYSQVPRPALERPHACIIGRRPPCPFYCPIICPLLDVLGMPSLHRYPLRQGGLTVNHPAHEATVDACVCLAICRRAEAALTPHPLPELRSHRFGQFILHAVPLLSVRRGSFRCSMPVAGKAVKAGREPSWLSEVCQSASRTPETINIEFE